ncbi:DUF1998 domain-containing protein [Methanothermobacter thermautotrophicus]|uniref:DUF1998 domain-containing protein n=1 Tax=Methanothermobacter thermautotrophicus TaxID=145262 RepID=UPI0022B9B13A|nr:DUF1998 domain-containing protein [Methanothermobacter thermautotrophicus]
MNDVQHLRRSQFIFTYGPGAILEGKNGPVMILSLNEGLGRYFTGEWLEKFEIKDSRLSEFLRKNKEIDGTIRLFSLPTNAALSHDENSYIYNTYRFPRWKICYGRREGGHQNPVLYEHKGEGEGCPLCGSKNASATRFVAACPDGHLDDLPWKYLVHSKETGCNPEYFHWKIEGPSIADIIIECPECGQSSSMRDIYRKKFRCTGRFPENRSGHRSEESCELEMKILQRQSTSLRIPVTLTLVKIPYKTELDEILESDPEFRGNLRGIINHANKENLLSDVKQNKIKYYDTVKWSIEEMGYRKFCEHVMEFSDRITENPLGDEFRVLREMRTSETLSVGEPVKFSVDSQIILKIVPVEKLKLTTAQIGYYRSPYLKKDENSEIIPSNIVSTGARDAISGSWWYPAFESVGEGLFITADRIPPESLSSNATEEWNERKLIHDEILRQNTQVSSEFVWWHTISHSIIRALSLYAGYSSPSIRERIYTESGGAGGILIYSSSVGDDCSMGGLSGCASESKFEEIWKIAMKNIEFCSSDPICNQNRISNGNYNGSACHSCLLLSETSCEHRNRWLDRHLVLGD